LNGRRGAIAPESNAIGFELEKAALWGGFFALSALIA
jgi:hypothetical protein